MCDSNEAELLAIFEALQRFQDIHTTLLLWRVIHLTRSLGFLIGRLILGGSSSSLMRFKLDLPLLMLPSAMSLGRPMQWHMC